jgi:hypothetical protein
MEGTYLWRIVKMAGLAGDATGLVVAGAGHVRCRIVPGGTGDSDGDEAEESDELHDGGGEK